MQLLPVVLALSATDGQMIFCSCEGEMTMSEESTPDRSPGRGVIEGAFQLLHALPQTTPNGQVAQLVRLTRIPRPTVHRLLAQLREAGAVDLIEGHWTLAAGLMGLARQVEPYAGLRESAADVLRTLRAGTGATASLVVPDSSSFVVLETVPGQTSLPVGHRPGDTMPHFSAPGLVLADQRGPSSQHRSIGVSSDHSAVQEGFTCYAVPVFLPSGRRAALQIASVEPRSTDRFAPMVHRAAASLQRLTALPS
ncbi:helix-turn-helix domain-containing protein [Promicromonospora sp. NPDC050880]|uniref:helix-turn-helix domain-containing protein n=1 Tax=unclassified Promicromonospora TaxID=2647929 RepID=UPI003792363B